MAFANPFELQLWDKNFSYVGTVGNIQGMNFTPRFNLVSQGEVILLSDNHYAQRITEKGMRYKLFFRGELLSTGRVTLREVEGLARTATLTATLTDDFVILTEVIAWPYPTGTKFQQYLSEHDKYSGSADGAVRYYFKRNAEDRLGLPVTTGTSAGLGETIKLAGRMVTLFDLFEPIFAKRDIGVRLIHRSGANISLEVYSPGEYPLTLSERSNHIQTFSYRSHDPEATRGIIGGAGEEKARIFEAWINPVHEAEYGMAREVFVDARDLGDDYREAVADRASKKETLTRELVDLNKAEGEYERKYQAMMDAYSMREDADGILQGAEVAYEQSQAAYKTANNYRTYIYSLSSSTATDKAEATEARDDANAARTKANTARTAANARLNAAQSKFTSAENAEDAALAQRSNARIAYNKALTEYDAAVALVPVTLSAHRIELINRGREKVTELAPKYGFSVTLGEALNFSYGPGGVKIGDRVTIEAGSLTLTDVLSEVLIAWNAENGLVVTPKTGEINDSPDRWIAIAIGKAFKAIRNMRTR